MVGEIFFDTISKSGTPELYRYWTRRSQCDPADRLILEAACDEFEALYGHAEEESSQLDLITAAACHPRLVVWEMGTLMLSQLAQSRSSARGRLLQMSRSAHSNIRLRSFAQLTDLFPREFCIELVLSAVQDKSERVAHAASWTATHLNLREVASAIRARESSIKHPIKGLEMRMLVGLLTQQYFEYHNENGYTLVLAFPDLFPNRIMWPGGVKEGEMKELGLEAIVSRVRSSDSSLNLQRRSWNWD